MARDKAFLMFIHDRLHYEHGEKETYDYMHKLRAIIRNTPEDKETPNIMSCNSLHELIEDMKKEKGT